MSEDPINELNLDILGGIPVGPGRKSMELHAEFSRELTPADLAIKAASVVKPTPIKRLRDSHHAAARFIALGYPNQEIALITGYSESRLSILKSDPTFQELVEFYRNNGTAKTAELRDRMLTIGLDALTVIQERLDEKPDDFKNGELRELVRDMADRTGHGPSSSSVNVSVSAELSDVMARARARVEQAKAKTTPTTIDVTPTQVTEE